MPAVLVLIVLEAAHCQVQPQLQPLEWSTGISNTTQILDVASIDTGSGPTVYAARTTNPSNDGLAYWSGGGWAKIPANNWVTSVKAVDVIGTPTLIASGWFSMIGGVSTGQLATYDGVSWSPLSAGLPGRPDTIEYYPPVGFICTESTSGSSVWVWSGTAWTSIASAGSAVTCMEILPTPSGPLLVVAGYFTQIGGVSANYIATFDGTTWRPLGAGLPSSVRSLQIYDDGSGPAIYAGGFFAGGLRRWSGASWDVVGGGVDIGWGLQAIDSNLYVYGKPNALAGLISPSETIFRWTGTAWEQIGVAPTGTPLPVFSIWDDGQTRKLAYLVENPNQDTVALYDPNVGWELLIDKPTGCPKGAVTVDDGSGPASYFVGNDMALPGGGVRSCLRWDGFQWTRLAGEIHGTPITIGYGDDGTGPTFWAGVSWWSGINSPSADPGYALQKWTGTEWIPINLGITAPRGSVTFIRPWDDGTGEKLYLGIEENSSGHAGIYTLDNGALIPVGGGLNGDVLCSMVHDDGTGEALYVGGRFSSGASQVVSKWDGLSWTPVGSGGLSASTDTVRSLTVHDRGFGPLVIAGGDRLSPNPTSLPSGIVWLLSGANWVGLGSISQGGITDVISFDTGDSRELLVVGSFVYISTTATAVSGIARWDGPGQWSIAGSSGPTPFQGLPQMVIPDPVFPHRLLIGGTNSTSAYGVRAYSLPGPILGIYQSASNGALSIANGGLIPGAETYNVFSVDLCPAGPGQGSPSLLGLCSNDLSVIINQVTLPLGTRPYRYLPTGAGESHGPYVIPPITLESVCFQFDPQLGQVLGASPVLRFSVQ